MQGTEIDLFGIDEFIIGRCPHVFDIVYEEGIRTGELGEEDNLSAAACKGEGEGGPNS